MTRRREFQLRPFFLLICLILATLIIPVKVTAEPIPEDVVKCIAYIVKAGDDKNTPIGTGFFISYKYQESSDKSYVFLVTAKHVLFDEKGQAHSQLLVRMNDKTTGHPKDFNILKRDHWFFYDDEKGVDIAIQPLLPRDADFLVIPSNLFVTKDLLTKNKIGIGDDVFYAGLLPYQSGSERIAPIVRFGRIALVTDERSIEGRYYYFIDAGNIPGHSGSPVFLWATPTRQSGGIVAGPRIFGLYGVVSGVLEYSKELKFVLPKQTQLNPIPVDTSSGGVTVIVPVKYLVEILESPPLKNTLSLVTDGK